MKVEASAPANIALIKYMGKMESGANSPINSSLSWTLDEMKSFVRVTLSDAASDQWRQLEGIGFSPLEMNKTSIDRYLRHFQYLKKEWGIEKNFLIESANNFPSDCGLASSASSFAALTKSAYEMFQKLAPRAELETKDIVDYSRMGSGSSCRSFFGPWALWQRDGVRPMEFPIGGLGHQVVIVESRKKSISSSEAHRRVVSSFLFQKRSERAERRLAELVEHFRHEDWAAAFETCWAEFWDMHALFETSQPSFGYMEPASLEVLRFAKELWRDRRDGPLVTMDAGPNVHFLWRRDQVAVAQEVQMKMSNKFAVLGSGKLNPKTKA